jgi:TRAP-type C4-dicarboxylate transport system substrate-binding protein
LLGTSGSPLALIMNRNRFDTLSKPAQDLIRKYSGEWAAARFIDSYDRSDELALEQLKSDPKRNVVFPSPSDLDRAQNAFKLVIAEWLERTPNHPLLLQEAESELARLRSPTGASQ